MVIRQWKRPIANRLEKSHKCGANRFVGFGVVGNTEQAAQGVALQREGLAVVDNLRAFEINHSLPFGRTVSEYLPVNLNCTVPRRNSTPNLKASWIVAGNPDSSKEGPAALMRQPNPGIHVIGKYPSAQTGAGEPRVPCQFGEYAESDDENYEP
jgi:hypothetical protein